MKNIVTTLEGNILTIRCDLSKTFGPSSSGKTTIIASTEGNVTPEGAPDNVKLGLNLYSK